MNNVTCGALIKKLRKEHNLTQTQLADMLSISQTPISRRENGDREISIYMIEKIAKVFGMTLLEFLMIFSHMSDNSNNKFSEYAKSA